LFGAVLFFGCFCLVACGLYRGAYAIHAVLEGNKIGWLYLALWSALGYGAAWGCALSLDWLLSS
jgi:hypothetical protein